jgi:hypothetical protein
MRLLAKTMDAKSQCVEGSPCACETSGSFTFQKEDTKVGVSARFTFESCVFADGNGFDGEALLVTSSSPIVGIAKKAAAAKSPATKTPTTAGAATQQDATTGQEPNLLLTAKGTASTSKGKMALEFSLAREDGYTLLSIEVPDGNVVVGASDGGDVFVKSKQGTWSCSPSAEGYACTSDGDGKKVTVSSSKISGEAAAKDDAKADATETDTETPDPAEDFEQP